MAAVDPSDITAEKSLLAILFAARKIPRNRFNRVCMIATFFALIAYAGLTRQSPHQLAEMIRAWANAGLAFAGTILGFLIAGYTIFAALSKPSLMTALARHVHPSSGLSYLKYSIFLFFETFAWYVGFVGLCVVVLVFGAVDGAATQLIVALPGSIRLTAIQLVPRFCMVAVGLWLILLCLELKSFVFNIHYIVTMSVQWAAEYPDKNETACHFTLPMDEVTPQTSSAAKREP